VRKLADTGTSTAAFQAQRYPDGRANEDAERLTISGHYPWSSPAQRACIRGHAMGENGSQAQAIEVWPQKALQTGQSGGPVIQIPCRRRAAVRRSRPDNGDVRIAVRGLRGENRSL